MSLQYKQGLLNIAPIGVASQSSLSQFSMPSGAQAAIEETDVADYAIHTDIESNPWWEVDLKHIYPIDLIAIHNRKLVSLQAKARKLKVEASLDGQNWMLLHQGVSVFGAAPVGRPFLMYLGGTVIMRYMRVSLDEEQCLHLSKIEIFINERTEEFRRFWVGAGLHYGAQFHGFIGTPINPLMFKYLFRFSGDASSKVNGLRLAEGGRFGNKIIQICNAIALAQKMNLKYIQFPTLSFIDAGDEVRIGDLILRPAGIKFPEDVRYLEGQFLYQNVFRPLLDDMSNVNKSAIISQFIKPILISRDLEGAPSEDELVIHIRSGDIFDANPHPRYAQPPFSYYKKVIDKMRGSDNIARVCVVSEDRLNPCIEAVERYVDECGLSYRYISGSFNDDMRFLIAAKHLVFGNGTFGLGICLLADEIETLHVFGTTELEGLPNVRKYTYVYDEAGKYIGKNDWKNTQEQRDLMLDYPVEFLSER